jgi:hypothetical protein
MQEQQRTEIARPAPAGGGLPDPFAGDRTVTVAHGPYAERLPVADLTVGQVRQRFRDRFDIDPESRPYVDGRPADDGTVVRAGQLLLFARRAGEKGRGRGHDRG